MSVKIGSDYLTEHRKNELCNKDKASLLRGMHLLLL